MASRGCSVRDTPASDACSLNRVIASSAVSSGRCFIWFRLNRASSSLYFLLNILLSLVRNSLNSGKVRVPCVWFLRMKFVLQVRASPSSKRARIKAIFLSSVVSLSSMRK